MKKLTLEEAVAYYESISPELTLKLKGVQEAHRKEIKQMREEMYRPTKEAYAQKGYSEKIQVKVNLLVDVIEKEYGKLVYQYNFILITGPKETPISLEQINGFRIQFPTGTNFSLNLKKQKSRDLKALFEVINSHPSSNHNKVNLLWFEGNGSQKLPKIKGALLVSSLLKESFNLKEFLSMSDELRINGLEYFRLGFEYNNRDVQASLKKGAIYFYSERGKLRIKTTKEGTVIRAMLKNSNISEWESTPSKLEESFRWLLENGPEPGVKEIDLLG
jgi:hypothetical protein